MEKKELHPSVIEFKKFVKSNPQIIQEVKEGKRTWQELYEDWYLLGEQDPIWDSFRSKDSQVDQQQSDWMSKIVNTISKMDSDQLQSHLNNANQAITAIIGVISQFQGGGGANNQSANPSQPNHPFSFRKD